MPQKESPQKAGAETATEVAKELVLSSDVKSDNSAAAAASSTPASDASDVKTTEGSGNFPRTNSELERIAFVV